MGVSDATGIQEHSMFRNAGHHSVPGESVSRQKVSGIILISCLKAGYHLFRTMLVKLWFILLALEFSRVLIEMSSRAQS